MSPKRVEYHQGATADVKSAVAWYQKRSRKAALDSKNCIEPPTQSVKLRNHGREQYEAVPALAIPVRHHLFRAPNRNHDLGCGPR